MHERDSLPPGDNAFVDFVCERTVDGSDSSRGDELVASALALSPINDTPADVLIAVTELGLSATC